MRKSAGGSADGLTSPLVLRADGQKFGKSESGEQIWLDAALTSPFKMHQFLLNCDDEITAALVRYLTFLDHDAIRELDEATRTKPQERRAQRALAERRGRHGPRRGRRREGRACRRGALHESIADLDEATLLEVVADAPSSTWSRDALARGRGSRRTCWWRAELASSKAEARRFLDQGGVYVNNVRVEWRDAVGLADALHGRYLVIRRGPRAAAPGGRGVIRGLAALLVAGLLLSACGSMSRRQRAMKSLGQRSAYSYVERRTLARSLTPSTRPPRFARRATTNNELHSVCGVLDYDTDAANAFLPTPDTQATSTAGRGLRRPRRAARRSVTGASATRENARGVTYLPTVSRSSPRPRARRWPTPVKTCLRARRGRRSISRRRMPSSSVADASPSIAKSWKSILAASMKR